MKKLMSIFSVTLFICGINLSSCKGSNSTNDTCATNQEISTDDKSCCSTKELVEDSNSTNTKCTDKKESITEKKSCCSTKELDVK
ncbi:MAG: hypothetical protein CMD02_06125 [Flavobacteriales bacterium]|nr:hypothetical protein [Flavobacteriales bacterium]|tara:strand:- start:1571 stop:1825 length:255 start_codon:yes stop_codon:yes gene_type:complete